MHVTVGKVMTMQGWPSTDPAGAKVCCLPLVCLAMLLKMP